MPGNKLAYFTNEKCLEHDIPGHIEGKKRLHAVDDAIETELDDEVETFVHFNPSRREELKLAHHPDYLDTLAKLQPKGKSIVPYEQGDPECDNQLCQGTLEAAKFASAAVTTAVNTVCKGKKYNLAFCNVRPPGHHASEKQAQGFCFYNNVAIAARYAQQALRLQRIVIIDFDAHHGNGTEKIIQNDPGIRLYSSYQKGIYPNPKVNPDIKNVFHLPLPAGSDATPLLQTLAESGEWHHSIKAYQPELILISAGFDAHTLDGKGVSELNLNFTDAQYQQLSALIRQLADNAPIVSVLEGGYNLKALASASVAHLQGLLHPELTPTPQPPLQKPSRKHERDDTEQQPEPKPKLPRLAGRQAISAMRHPPPGFKTCTRERKPKPKPKKR